MIVPVYNKEKYISECIDSLISQTYQDLEIILVDDESTDSSGRICDEYAASDERIKALHAHGGGPAAACLTGLNEASGDYVCFVDSDDWVDTDMIEKLAACTSGRDDEIILSDYIIEREDGTKTYVYQDIEPGEYADDDVFDKVIPKLWGLEDRAVSQSRCMKLYSMPLARKNIHYPEPDLKFAEDAAFLLPCVLDAGRMYFLDRQAMYHYRYVNDSAVHKYTETMTSDICRVRDIINRAISDKFSKDPSRESYLKELYRAESVILLIFAVKNELRGDKETCTDSIQSLCLAKDNAAIIRDYPVKIKHMANRLIYHTMKHPTKLNCRVLKMIMDMH